jgi:hypothetical protein
MAMTLWPGEVEGRPWRAVPLSEFMRLLGVALRADAPAVVAIDGRGGAGKSTLAARLEAEIPGSATIHTDDIAWNHSIFGWVDVLVDGVLAPAREQLPVSFTPPGWERHGRAGRVMVPAGTSVIWLEGTGAARRELKPFVDAAVWVQSDRLEAERRLAARDGVERSRRELAEWLPEELPFFLDQRPWETASVIVAGTPVIHHDARSEVVIAPPSGQM